MAIPEVIKYKIPRFWDNDFKRLDYIQEPFNDPASVELWRSQGYTAKFTGYMCDMRHSLPSWSQRIVDIYQELGWQNIGLSFYRMPTMTVLPVHQDLYKKYIELFGLQGRETTIRRALILLEDWQSGHYLEVNGSPILNWKAGDTVEWVYNTPHMAANIGITDRYTLQVTGHYDIKFQ